MSAVATPSLVATLAPYAAAIADVRGRSGGEPSWLRTVRQDAAASFLAAGIPTTRDEDYRFTNLRSLSQTAYGLPSATPSIARADIAEYILADAYLLVAVNGKVQWDLSTKFEVSEGSGYGDLGQSLTSVPALWEPEFGRLAHNQYGAFEALNLALWESGVFLYLSKGTILDKPLQILHVAVAGTSPALLAPRTHVVLQENAQATIIETHVSLGLGPSLVVAATDLVADASARLEYVQELRQGSGVTHLGTLRTMLDRDSQVTVSAIALGADLVRVDCWAHLEGEGADCTLRGLSLAEGTRHIDFRTTVDHALPHTYSRQLFKGIYDDDSSGVFTGRVIVRPDAQKIAAEQENKNLLLSERATVHTQPQLEIYADDVKCSHGATIGQLDEDQLFYLQARGIEASAAKAMLTVAFADDLLDQIVLAPLRDRLEALMVARLATGHHLPPGLGSNSWEEAIR